MVKIFAILTNSMPEECTVSRFTRLDCKVLFTPKCKQRLVVLNLVENAEPADIFSSVASPVLDLHRDGSNVTLPFFKDLLSDKSVDFNYFHCLNQPTCPKFVTPKIGMLII